MVSASGVRIPCPRPAVLLLLFESGQSNGVGEIMLCRSLRVTCVLAL